MPPVQRRVGAILTPTAVRMHLDRQSILLRLTVHDLRRPLAVLDGYLSMMRDASLGTEPGSDEAGRAMMAMAGAVQEMAALVEGLAAVARGEDQTDFLRLRRCRIGAVVARAAASVELEARVRKVDIGHVGDDVEADVDPHYLRIAMVNLLANAIQYSPAGSTVTVTTSADEGTATITVADCGPGIDPADIEHVFDPWYQGSGVSGGLGLGLWIVRQIVELHGGRVMLHSSPGQGSTFSMLLASGTTTPRPAPQPNS